MISTHLEIIFPELSEIVLLEYHVSRLIFRVAVALWYNVTSIKILESRRNSREKNLWQWQRLLEEVEGPGRVRFHAVAAEVHDAELRGGLRVAQGVTLLEERKGLGHALLHALAELVQHAEVEPLLSI